MSYLLDRLDKAQLKDCQVNIEKLQQDLDCLTSGGDMSHFFA